MDQKTVEKLGAALRDVPDFPKPGIIFKDIAPVLETPELFRESVDLMADQCEGEGISKIVGIDSRGFLFGSAVAYKLGLGLVMVRKAGKLPYQTRQIAYSLEYGEATVEMHVDSLKPGERVALVDDLLATGGTAAAALQLIAEAEAEAVKALFLVELDFLKGRERLSPVRVESFVRVAGE